MAQLIKRFLPFVSLIVLCVVIAALEPKFLSGSNLAGIARQTAVITIMAIGMTMVMVSAGIDLSVGRRRRHLCRQCTLCPQQRRLNVYGGIIDVAVLLELQGDRRIAERARRTDYRKA